MIGLISLLKEIPNVIFIERKYADDEIRKHILNYEH